MNSYTTSLSEMYNHYRSFSGKGCDNPEALQRILILSWEKIKEHHDIEQKLKDNCRKNGYEFHGETPRDGNCFFEAIASQLNRINAEKRYSSKQLRQEITEYILQHPTIEVSIRFAFKYFVLMLRLCVNASGVYTERKF